MNCHLSLGFLASVFFHCTALAQTVMVSVSSSGVIGNGDCGSAVPAVSADGRFVAFSSHATNFVPNDTNGWRDIFVHDALTGTTEIVSVSSTGAASNANCFSPAITPDGRFVAFSTSASTLVAGDTNGTYDIFVHDRQTGATELISMSTGGAIGNGLSETPTISSDGRYVAFASLSTNLAPGATTGIYNVFVRDREAGTSELVSVTMGGAPGNDASTGPSISADGRYVAFSSDATNLVVQNSNFVTNVFVRDRVAGQTTIVSVSSAGAVGNSSSYQPSISADGQFIAFASAASNLVSNDTNGFDDIFVRDVVHSQTERISISIDGTQANSYCFEPSISNNGSRVAFASYASSLAANDQGTYDIFVHDRNAGFTVIVDCSTGGEQGNAGSYGPAISRDGGFVAYWSGSTNLVPNDTNGTNDVFESAVVAPTGLPVPYGTGTPGCAGPHVHSGLNAPKIGNAQFTVKCTAAPPNGLGGWWIADTQDLVGSDPFGVGIKLHLDLFNAVEFFAFDLYADASGVATAAVGIPNNPILVGKTYYSQVVWAWPLTTCHNFPYGLSSSNGISITIQQ
jgi:Tol biopolymer transport system component